MRITRSMMVNNMLHWTEQQMEKLNDASNIVASGKQINKPSDDPSATGKILSDKATLSLYGQYESNITQAETWIKTSSTTLEAVDSFLAEAQDIMSSLSSADEATREGYLETLENIYNQVMDLANSKYGSSYMYGGNVSDTAPFSSNSVSITTVPGDIVFDQAGDASDLTITITDSTGTEVQTLTTADGVNGTNTISWDGKNANGEAVSVGDYDFTVTDTDGNIVAAYASYRGDDGRKTMITGENSSITLNNNGGEIFSDALSVLSQAITAIKNSNELSDLGDAFDAAIAAVEAEQISLANTNSQLEYKNDRLTQLVTNASNRISDVEVGSTEEAAIKLEVQETAYEVTLEAVANVLKMTKLSDLI